MKTLAARHARSLLLICVVLLAATAVLRTVVESHRLLFGQGFAAATDLKLFHEQCVTWFGGEDAYAKLVSAVYPPGSYPLMAPLYLWDIEINRGVWLVHSLIVLGVLMWLCVVESGAPSALEKAGVALLPLAMYGTGIALGNGQLTIHVLTAVVASIVLLDRGRGRLGYDLAAAALMLFALVKPSLSPPFFWVLLFVPRRLRPALLVLIGYITLTLIGASFQPGGLVTQFTAFLGRGTALAVRAGYGHVPLWLTEAGHGNLIMPFTLVALVGMGVWVWRHRDVDRWLLLGVLALLARFWSYHRLYDDMLNLLPMIALIRLGHGRAGNAGKPDQLAWMVLCISLVAIPGPATPLQDLESGLGVFMRLGQNLIRLLMLAFLMRRAWEQRNRLTGAIDPSPINPVPA